MEMIEALPMIDRPASSTPAPRKRFGKILAPVMLLCGMPVALIVGCQSKLLYFPRPYPQGIVAAWQKETTGVTIDFKTSQGSQRAFLQGELKSPRNLWIVCGGNATVALDWSRWIAENAPSEDAWLLVDFPGYGDCEGSPSPERIRETFMKALPAATMALDWPASPDPARLRFFGHSLGSAACLIAATEFHIQRGVLLSPFTSTMEMGREITGLPVGFLVTHRFDNEARLEELTRRGDGEVIILHGTDDRVIPVAMARRLASSHAGTVSLREIPGGRHDSIPHENAGELSRALIEVGN